MYTLNNPSFINILELLKSLIWITVFVACRSWESSRKCYLLRLGYFPQKGERICAIQITVSGVLTKCHGWVKISLGDKRESRDEKRNNMYFSLCDAPCLGSGWFLSIIIYLKFTRELSWRMFSKQNNRRLVVKCHSLTKWSFLRPIILLRVLSPSIVGLQENTGSLAAVECPRSSLQDRNSKKLILSWTTQATLVLRSTGLKFRGLTWAGPERVKAFRGDTALSVKSLQLSRKIKEPIAKKTNEWFPEFIFPLIINFVWLLYLPEMSGTDQGLTFCCHPRVFPYPLRAKWDEWSLPPGRLPSLGLQKTNFLESIL